jgi:hypothetical protein
MSAYAFCETALRKSRSAIVAAVYDRRFFFIERPATIERRYSKKPRCQHRQMSFHLSP